MLDRLSAVRSFERHGKAYRMRRLIPRCGARFKSNGGARARRFDLTASVNLITRAIRLTRATVAHRAAPTPLARRVKGLRETAANGTACAKGESCATAWCWATVFCSATTRPRWPSCTTRLRPQPGRRRG